MIELVRTIQNHKTKRKVVMLYQAPKPLDEPSVSLTLATVGNSSPSGSLRVPASKLLTYDQQMGFTRLRLTGRTVLDVRESTDQIDRLVRAAASRGHRNRVSRM
jgi:hypothetical protein